MSTKPLACKHLLDADRAELYDILISHLTDSVVFLMDCQGCIASWNPGVARILGYSEDDWLEQSADLTFTEEDRASGRLQQELLTATNVGQTAEVCWHVRRDGSPIYVHETMVALHDSSGQLLGFSKVMHDLTERKRREVQLQDALSYTESILDTIRQPLVVLDEQFKVRSTNAAFCRAFHLTRERIEGRSIYRLMDGEWNIPQLHSLLESLLPTQSVVEDFELEHTFLELGHKVMLLNGRKLMHEGSHTELIVLAIEDITDRKQAERALTNIEKQRRLIMDAAPAIISYIGSDLRFRVANSAYERWFGESPDKLVGKHISEAFDSPLLDTVKPYLQKVLAGEAVAFEAEYPGLTEERTLQVTYTPDFDEAGSMQGFVVLGSDITGRKKIELALRRSEERWRTLFESMAEGFCIVEIVRDASGRAVDCRFVEVNPAFESITGLINAIGKTFRERIPGIQDSLIQTYGNVLDTGESAHFEVLVPALRNAWYEVRAYRTDSTCVAVLFLDIAERKKVEAQLRKNEERQTALIALGDRLRELSDPASLIAAAMEILGSTLQVARAGYGQVDFTQNFVTINDEWTNGVVSSLAGTYRFDDFGEDLKGKLRRGESFVVPDVTTHPVTMRDNARWKALEIASVVNLPLFESGRLVAILFIQDSVPRVWTEGDLSFLRKVADRTWAAAERSRALKELQESEAFTRSVLSSSPDCIKVMDLEGRLLTINEGGCDQMEIDDISSCLNRPWAEFWGQSAAVASEALDKARAGFTQRFEGFCPTAKGTSRWWEVVVSPIRDNSGEPVRILSLSRDITERKVAEQERERLTAELQRSNEDLSQFAHTVAHDLQTPLRGVTVFAQLLHRHAAERLTGKDGEFLEHIVTSARRMAELVQGLLRFAQIGQGQIERKPVDMNATLHAALQSVQLQIDEQAAVINARELPAVMGDSVQLSQLLQNLISNAIKYHRPGVPPEVEISASQDGAYYLFSVCDNGEGIATEHLKTVFEPLKRFHDGDVSGSGLGLAVCHRIIARHGGRIWVESQVGHGSCFYFTLSAS